MATAVNGSCGGQRLDKCSMYAFTGAFAGFLLYPCQADTCSRLHFFPIADGVKGHGCGLDSGPGRVAPLGCFN